MAQQQDKNQKTIEHPTDIEDANNYESNTEFEHVGPSPDIKLKSIEVDEEFMNKGKHYDNSKPVFHDHHQKYK